MSNQLFRKKSVERIMRDHAQREADGHQGMKRTLTVRDLTLMGVALSLIHISEPTRPY